MNLFSKLVRSMGGELSSTKTPPPCTTTTPTMAPFWLLYAAALLPAIVLLLRAFSGSHRRRLNLPPGPKPWPIIGNLNLIGSLPHHSLHSLSQKHGPLMQLRYGSFPVIVASTPEMAKHILKTHDLTFAYRPKSTGAKHLFYNHSNITFSPYGPYWRQARKLCLTELLSPKRLSSFGYIRAEEVKSLVCDLFAMAGKAIVVKDYLSAANLNVISRMVLGEKYLGGAEVGAIPPEQLRKTVDDLFELLGVVNIGDYIPWFSFLDLRGYVKRMKVVSKNFDAFLEHVLNKHSSRSVGASDFVAKDMVDVLLQHAEDPNLEVKFTRTRIKAFLLDMIAGSIDTSAVTLERAISVLLKRPNIINKAVEELDRVIGKDRWVEEKDIPHLPYIEAILKETMRMHPATPLLAPHVSHVDCTIAGYDIPAGTIAFVNVWAIGRDAKTWDDPGVFRPERFIGKTIDVRGQDFELLPFGSGRRMCPGYSLALKLIHLSLSNLLHGFVWRMPENMSGDQLDMDEIFALATPRNNAIMAVVEPRLPNNLYCM